MARMCAEDVGGALRARGRVILLAAGRGSFSDLGGVRSCTERGRDAERGPNTRTCVAPR
jgi:hypothetical protein